MTNEVETSSFSMKIDQKEYDEDEDLRYLLEKYLQRTEELENRENKVLKQIELMQSAVSSLQDWNQSRKASRSSSEPVKIDVREIEEETKSIREETKRIQREIEKKMKDNEKLQEEVIRRKTLQSYDFRISVDEGPTSNRNPHVIAYGNITGRNLSEQDSFPGIDYFDEKLQKLKQMEQKLVKESQLKSGELKRKQKNLEDKVEMLEWESRMDKQIIETLRKKKEKK